MTNLNVDLKFRVSGHFNLAIQRESGEIETVADFDNLIVDAGLDALHSSSSSFSNCMVGTGTTPPATTQTTLVNRIASTTNTTAITNTTNNASPYDATMVITYQFATGVAAGNLTEVGIGTTSTLVMSRALIVDGSGNPITITVLATEALFVTYTFKVYPPIVDNVFSVSGYTFTARAIGCGLVSSWVAGYYPGAISGMAIEAAGQALTAAYSALGGTTISNATYVAGTFYRDITITYPIGIANYATGIGTLGFRTGSASYPQGVMSLQFSISPKIMKTSSQTLTITYRLTIARYP
jgi:hypothetical protein